MALRMYQVDYYEGNAWHTYLCVGSARKDVEQREYISFLAEGRRIPKHLFKVHRVKTVDGYYVKLISAKTYEKEYEKRRLMNEKQKERLRQKKEKETQEQLEEEDNDLL